MFKYNPYNSFMKENRLIYMAGPATPGTPGTPTTPTPPPAEEEQQRRNQGLDLINADQQNEQLRHYSSKTLEELNRLKEKTVPFIEDNSIVSEMDQNISEINEYNYYGKFLQHTLRSIDTNNSFWLLPAETEGKAESLQAFKDSLFHARKTLGISGVSTASIDAVATKKQAMDVVRSMMRKVKEQKDKAERTFLDRVDSTLLREIDKIEENYKNSPQKTEAMKKQVAALRETIDLLRKISGKSKPQRIQILTEYTGSNEYIHLGTPSEQVKELERHVQGAPGVREALIGLKAHLLSYGVKAGDVNNLRQIILGLLNKHVARETNLNKKKKLTSVREKLQDMDESTREMKDFIGSNWYLISPEEYEVDMTTEELKSIDEEPDFTNDITMRLELMHGIKAREGYSEEAKTDSKKSENVDTASVEKSFRELREEKKKKVDPLVAAIKGKAQAMIDRIDNELFPIISTQFKGEDKKDLKDQHTEGLVSAKKSLAGWMDMDKTYDMMLEGPAAFEWEIDKDGNVIEKEGVNPGIAQYIALATDPRASESVKKGALLSATEMMDLAKATLDDPKNVLEKFMPEYNNSISGYKTHLLNKTRQSLNTKYQIYFLSVQDFQHMGEKLVEWAKRKYNRRSDAHMGDFGTKLFKGLPGPLKTASNEFDRLKEHAEIEEVEQYENAYKNKDAWMIMEKMETTKNVDEFKACIKLLSHHGRMRLENIKFWKQLMYFSHGTVQFDVNNPEAETGRKHMFEEKLSKAIGYIWDFDTYEKWVQENGTNAGQEREKYNSYCDQTAESAGGIDGAMATMLSAYKAEKKHGHIPKIDPHKFEKLIHYGIDKGKGSPESKLYFLIQGVACGLLPHSTLSKISSLKINDYPVIDLLGSGTERGERPTPKDVKEWARIDWDLNQPGAAFHKWWYTKLLHMPKIYQRVSKALVQGISQDHDDATGWFGAADMNTMKTVLSENAQGLRMPPTGIQNATVGILHYFDNLMEFGNELPLEGESGLYDQFARLAGAFAVMDGITSDRMFKGHLNYFRWRGSDEREPRSTYLYKSSYGRGTGGADLAAKGRKTQLGFTSGLRTKDYVSTIREYMAIFDKDYFGFLMNKSSSASPGDIAGLVNQMKARYGQNVFEGKDPTTGDALHEATQIFVKNAMRTNEGKRRFMSMRSTILQDHRDLIKTTGIQTDCVFSRLDYINQHKKELDDEIAGKGHGLHSHALHAAGAHGEGSIENQQGHKLAA